MEWSIVLSSAGYVWVIKREPGFTKEQLVGRIVGDTLHVRKDPSRHLYNLTQSYAVNREVLELKKYRFVCIHLKGGGCLVTTRTYFLEKGRPLLERGYDEQVQLRVVDFGLDKALEYEREKEKRKRLNPNMYDILAELNREENDKHANNSAS